MADHIIPIIAVITKYKGVLLCECFYLSKLLLIIEYAGVQMPNNNGMSTSEVNSGYAQTIDLGSHRNINNLITFLKLPSLRYFLFYLLKSLPLSSKNPYVKYGVD